MKRIERPFPHAVLHDFLPPAEARKLEAALRKQRFARKDADLFSFSQTGDLHMTKDRIIKEFLARLQSRELTKQVNDLMQVKTTPGRVDAAGFLYTDGDYLLCHDDGVSSRRIAYIYNLSRFSPGDGGALCLLNAENHRPTTVAKRIVPGWNTLVLFNVTRDSHHQVEEVLRRKERLSITGWFHA